MLSKIGKYYYRLKRLFSRSHFYVRFMRLGTKYKDDKNQGLILIQIDGLAKNQLEKAFEKNKMPFLKSLLKKQSYKICRHFPGFPSTTPAVQGELFYNVKQAVPAFGFVDKERNKKAAMLDPAEAKKIENEISANSKGLLHGGSAYCDIYSGGAEETHFCVSDFTPEGLFRHRYPFGFLLLLVFNIVGLIRMAGLIIAEFFLAAIDVLKGVLNGKSFVEEIKFIPSRAGTCVFLRELAVNGAGIDIARNLPAIHINFLGYDEQSHRRGPSSLFAHWSLKGIDDAIKRIYRSAQKSPGRHYDLWVYSDHGQEETKGYARHFGRSVKSAIADQVEQALAEFKEEKSDRRDNVYPGIKARDRKEIGHSENLLVSATGPLGHIYLTYEVSPRRKAEIARKCVNYADIPLAAVIDENDNVSVFTSDGVFTLPEQADMVFDPNHPYLNELAEDFTLLCRHKNAGDIIISGWNKHGKNYTFPEENGSHAGPGINETDAFIILPKDVSINDEKGHVRPADIYKAAMDFRENNACRAKPAVQTEQSCFRLMTYNVHSCIGIDGKNSPARIARIIAQNDPDIVSLQELDHGRKRTSNQNQAELISRLLNMEYHYHPVMTVKKEKYGDALLTRLPVKKVTKHNLPKPGTMKWLEPRGAIEATLSIGRENIRIINTHLGLTNPEKIIQVKYILEKILSQDDQKNTILCGDFNFSQNSGFYKQIRDLLKEGCEIKNNKSSINTWPCRYPVTKIDHIFFKGDIEISDVQIIKNDLSMTASDHLPLIADFKLNI